MSTFNHSSTQLLRCRIYFYFSLLLNRITFCSMGYLLEAEGEEFQGKTQVIYFIKRNCRTSRKRKYKVQDMGQMANSVVTLLSTLASRLFLCQDLSRTALPFCQYVCNLRPFCKKKKKKQHHIPPPFPRWRVDLIFSIPAFSNFSFILCLPVSFPHIS